MPELVFDSVPEAWDKRWMEDTLRRLQRGMAPTLHRDAPQRIELNADTGTIPLLRAHYPQIVRRVSIWSPIDVESSPSLYTILDVRNKEANVSLLPVAGGFSTSGGLQKEEWRVIAALDDVYERQGSNMVLERNQTLILKWEHFKEQIALTATTRGGEYEEQGEAAQPEEVGALLVDLWCQVEVERV